MMKSKNVMDKKEEVRVVGIKPPNLKVASFLIKGIDGPLVQKRMGAKLKDQLLAKQVEGKPAGSKHGKRTPQDVNVTFNDARYISKEGWDGFHAGGIRLAMVSVCRLVDFKMTLARLSIFVLADGYDAKEPQVPLIRIYGKPEPQTDIARVETGQPYVTIRAAYHNWTAKIRIRYDADQFSLADVTNLLARVGAQNGIGEGRHNSKNSCGLGWGCFELDKADLEKAAA